MGAVWAVEAWEGGWAAVPVCCGDWRVDVGVDDVAEYAGEAEEGGSLGAGGGHGVGGYWSISLVLCVCLMLLKVLPILIVGVW